MLAETRGANVICDVEAEAGVSDLVIRHRSEELKRRGIPESFSLTNMSTEVQEAVNAAGIVWLPLSPAGHNRLRWISVIWRIGCLWEIINFVLVFMIPVSVL